MPKRKIRIIKNDRLANEYEVSLTTSGGVDFIRNLTVGKDIPSYTKMYRRIKDWVKSPNDEFKYIDE